LLGEGCGVVTERWATAEGNIGDDGCAERERNELVVRLCMRRVVIPVHQISTGFTWPVFLMTSGEM